MAAPKLHEEMPDPDDVEFDVLYLEDEDDEREEEDLSALIDMGIVDYD